MLRVCVKTNLQDKTININTDDCEQTIFTKMLRFINNYNIITATCSSNTCCGTSVTTLIGKVLSSVTKLNLVVTLLVASTKLLHVEPC